MTTASARPVSLSADRVLALRLRAQRLAQDWPAGEPPVTATQVLSEVCGLQAQEIPAAALAVRARGGGPRAEDVEHARLGERSLVRSWLMRGTLHLVAAQDFGWLVRLLGPGLLAGSLRRLNQMGLDESTTARAVEQIEMLLAERGPLTRVEIAEELARRSGIRAEGQARIHLIYQAAMRGILCQGPDRDGEPAYVRVEDWLGSRGEDLTREQALARLAQRYLDAYGPAAPRDLAAWSGLGLGEARRGWEQVAGRVEIELEGQSLWLLPSQAAWLDQPLSASPQVSLLPRYDTYLLGYASRDLSLAPAYARRINAGGGIIHPALLVNGRVRGTWSMEKKKGRLAVQVDPFEPLEPKVEPGIQAEIEDIRRFLGDEAFTSP